MFMNPFLFLILFIPTPLSPFSLSHAGVKGVVKPWQWLNGDIIFWYNGKY